MSLILRPADPSTASRTRQPVDSVVTEPCDHPDFSVTEPCDGPDETLTVSYSPKVKPLRRKRHPGARKATGPYGMIIENMRNIIALAPSQPRPTPAALTKIGNPGAAKKRTHFLAKSDALGGWRRGWLLS